MKKIKQISCDKCNNNGRYYRPEDRDIAEGYKLATLYYCDCKYGQEKKSIALKFALRFIDKTLKDIKNKKIDKKTKISYLYHISSYAKKAQYLLELME